MDWIANLPILAALLALMACSAFFSASEAALFYLQDRDLRQLAKGGSREQAVVALLRTPERVLSGILFWNLMVNMATFALTSLISLRLDRSGQTAAGIVFAFGSVFAIIFFAEVLPKSVAVLKPRWFAVLCAQPIQFSVNLVSPLLPLLNSVNDWTLRLLWPSFQPEPYLSLRDLERAVQMSDAETALAPAQRRALENIVSLSDRRIDEWMRPSRSLPIFSPKVTIEQLRERADGHRHVLLTEPDSDEIAKSIWLPGLVHGSHRRLYHHAEPVVFVPWCTSVASVVDKLVRSNLQVAAVVNEHGQAIGVMTLEDILETLFAVSANRDTTQDEADEPSIRPLEEGRWMVSGATSLRSLGRELQVELPDSRNVTVRGVIQEVLQRLARVGDTCRWGRFEFTVVSAGQRGSMRVLTRLTESEELRSS